MLNPHASQLPPDQQQNLRLAIQYHQGGHLQEAGNLYRRIHAMYPNHPETLHRLGVLLMQQGSSELAVPFLEKAREVEPDNGANWLVLTQCLLDLGRSKDAKKIISEAIRKGLRHPMADEMLERARVGQGKPAKRSISPAQELAAIEQMLKAGDYVNAESHAQTIAGGQPKLAQAWHVLAMARMAQKKYLEAVEPLERALRLNPKASEVHYKLGYCRQQILQLDKAAEAFMDALKINPQFLEARDGLILTLGGLGRDKEVVEVCRQVLLSSPDDFSALNNLGLSLHKCGRNAEAIEVFKKALKQGNNYAELYANYGDALRDEGKFDDAISAYRRAMELNPNFLGVRSNLIFSSNLVPDINPDELLSEARAYGKVAAGRATPYATYDNSCEPDRRLRVGLVSGDLGEHSVGHFLEAVLADLDPEKIELFAYATTYRQDALNKKLRLVIPHWCDASPADMADQMLAQRIREDRIDILVDLAGHTDYSRLPVFAWKPAPVQVTWLGYFGTTGLEAIDYILADRWVLPPEEEKHFVEKPWRLPDGYYCFTPPTVSTDTTSLPATRNGYITFGCFNNLRKVNERVIACWARILAAVPNSHLYLKSKVLGDAQARERIKQRFEIEGVNPERIRLEGESPREEYFAAYNDVDIALDPYPYTGGTTTVQGLWMGVPAVTLKGNVFLGHQGETILHNAGLHDWIAENEESYIEKAVAFSGDLEKLVELRAGLREQVLASPLFDAPRFARNLEEAFRDMWHEWCRENSRHHAI